MIVSKKTVMEMKRRGVGQKETEEKYDREIR